MTDTDITGQPADDAMSHRRWRSLFLIVLMLASAVLSLAACGGRAASGTKVSASERYAIIRQAALQYATDANLPKAKETIAKLNLANPGQIVLSMAEQAINDGKPATDIAALARLAEGLGARSPKLVAYLAPTATPSPLPRPTSTVAPPSPTAIPPIAPPAPATTAPTDTPTTAASPTTTASPTAIASPLPQKPRVVADSTANLRGGPGTGYPTVGQMAVGKEVDIIGRNSSGDWWRIAWDGAGQAWVAGLVVRVLGPIDTVAVAKDIPALPTRPPAPPTQPPAPTAPPKPAVEYVVKSFRLIPKGQDAQQCNGGNHNIFVQVLDKGGAPLVDGVRVREGWRQQNPDTAHDAIKVTGAKGPGRAEWDIYRGGGGQLDIVNESGNRISELSRGMSADWPDFDLIQAAGYCDCRPYLDAASCRAGLEGKEYSYFPIGHYAFEVIFQRTW
ncbi:MAG: SH3 domain-containing protein [Anaerolineae bacterium]|nr:SH3 domain-containing protein [Anaerolineae bacterium]